MENKKQSKLFYGWIVVLGCVLITMTMVPPIMALSNKYLIYVTEDLGISRSAFTLANTILQGLGIFISPMVAKNLAKGDMKKIMTISVIGYAACYASYSFARSPIHLYISALLLGVFYLNATLIPVSMMVTNWFVKQRGLAMSLAMAGIGVGGTIFSPILTFLLESYGWRNTYRIMALTILVVALPTTLFILKKKPEDMGLSALGAGEAPAAGKKAAAQPATLKLSVFESKGQLCCFTLYYGIFFWFRKPIETVSPPLVTAEVFGQDKYSEAYGIANSFSQVGLSISSLLVAAMYDASGSYTTAWVVFIIFTALTLVGWVGSAALSKKYKV